MAFALKALSCLPITCVCPFAPNYLEEYFIGQKIDSEQDPKKKIFLFEHKNHYKYSNVVSSLSTLILAITGIAFNVFTSPLVGVFVSIFCVSLCAYQIHAIRHNQKIIHHLQTGSGLIVAVAL